MTSEHTFCEALEAMKRGEYARLPHWQPGVYMFLHRPAPESLFNTPFFCMRTPKSTFPCEPTQTGILSDHWEIQATLEP